MAEFDGDYAFEVFFKGYLVLEVWLMWHMMWQCSCISFLCSRVWELI